MSTVADPVSVGTDLDLFCEFCRELVLEDGRHMEVEPFQRTMLADYFAGMTETVVIIPKKNGKTTTLGALALFHLLTTTDAECVIGAAARDQAEIMRRQAAGLIRRSPTITDAFVVKGGYREIRSASDAGRVRVLSSDADTSDGVIPTLALIDELHRHRSGDLYGVFRDGLGPRHGRMITISTAGSDVESPLGALRKRAYELPGLRRRGPYRKVRSPDGEFGLHEWALEASDDLDDLDLVKAANPASWQTREALAQRHASPSTTSWQWARFACGVWVRGYETWIPRYRWDERAYDQGGADENAADPDGRIPKGAAVVLAFDGSYNMDSTGIVACTVPRLAQRLTEDSDLPQYDGPPPHLQVVECWERPEGAPDDWAVPVLEVEAAIRAACRFWKVREIVADTYRWQRSFEILKRERRPVVDYPQRPSRMVPATTTLTTAVMNGAVTHDGDERLARHVENAVLKITDSGGQLAKPSKTGPLRIDLAVCAVLAFERAHFQKGSASVIGWADASDDDAGSDDLIAEMEREAREFYEDVTRDEEDEDE